jgi:dUTP pyrophosphatase
MGYTLYICPTEEMKETYSTAAAAYLSKPYTERDAGFDVFSASDKTVDETGAMLGMGCSAAFWDGERGMFRAYWLLPRSSISKTPLRMKNSVGLIDAGYRGELLAAVDTRVYKYTCTKGTRLFQLSSPDLLPWDDIRIVDSIPGGPTLRGAGGFGSTGSGSCTVQQSNENEPATGMSYFV